MGKVKPNPLTRRHTYIKEWRKHRELTLEQVAERIGVTAGALSQLERGDTSYTQPMLEALAGVLQCEPADLIQAPPGLSAIRQTLPQELVKLWSAIPRDDREKALLILSALAKKL